MSKKEIELSNKLFESIRSQERDLTTALERIEVLKKGVSEVSEGIKKLEKSARKREREIKKLYELKAKYIYISAITKPKND